ncbi:orotate phosphoribosyltransferase [Candidatus Aminicenantes bacterium AH-873-B07]|nr:orotate phosphoribosyltransferase [Candidatus Aminicenantes bacterium AH-873-B07]
MKERLIEILKEKSVITGVEIILTSGRKSNYYIDCKMTTLDPEGANLVGKLILEVLEPYQIDAIGGYTLGADPIVSAVATISYQVGKPLPAFIVRKEPKKHGEQKMIEGPFKAGWKVAIIDDVCTTGGSILKACKAVEEAGGEIVLTMVIVDRLEGGRENIEKNGYKFISLLTKKDLEL